MLQNYLNEKEDRRAGALFDQIFQQQSAWLVRFVASNPSLNNEMEDVLQDIRLKFWRALEKHRTGNGGGIRQVRPYLRIVAKSVLIDSGPRRESRQYTRLFRKVGLLFSPQYASSPFGRWDWKGALLCGFQAWHEDMARHATWQKGDVPTPSSDNRIALERFLHSRASQSELEKDLLLLVGLILTWLDAPIRLNELVEWVALVSGLTPIHTIMEAELRNEEGELPEDLGGVTAISPEQEVVGVQGLRTAFRTLPPRSQLVLLLALDREEVAQLLETTHTLDHLTHLLVSAGWGQEYGTVTQVANLWIHLPLKDAELATLFSTTVGNIQVLRNRARKLFRKKYEEMEEQV